MKPKLIVLSRRYVTALRRHLKQGQHADLASARGLGSQALTAGLQILDFAKLHEQTLVTELLPGFAPKKRATLIRQAGIFFGAAIVPFEKSQRSAREAIIQKKFIETLSQRTVELAASNLELSQEII